MQAQLFAWFMSLDIKFNIPMEPDETIQILQKALLVKFWASEDQNVEVWEEIYVKAAKLAAQHCHELILNPFFIELALFEPGNLRFASKEEDDNTFS